MKKRLTFLKLALLLLICPDITFAQTASDTLFLKFASIDKPPSCFIEHNKLERPKIGLALSGGGARGIAQVGALQVLEENDIPVDYIVGVSIGSIIGGLYAVGYSPNNLQQLLNEVEWGDIIDDKPPRSNLFIGQKHQRDIPILQMRLKGFTPVIPKAITAGQRLSSVLTELSMRAGYTTISDFDDLKIPFRALSCDLITGNKIILKSGDLAEAMRASSTIPLLFSPVAKDSMLLVDGGLINNIPVDETREQGADIVLAIDTSSNLHGIKSLNAPWIIADQVTTIMQREKKKEQRHSADILIRLSMQSQKSDNFDNIEELINAGRLETQKKIHAIKKLINSRKKSSFNGEKILLSEYRIKSGLNNHNYLIHDKLKSRLNGYVLLRELYELMEKIYETGVFSNVFIEYFTDGKIIINMLENESFSHIHIKGNTIFNDSLITARIETKKNLPVNYYQSKYDLENILKLYRDQGYSLARMKTVTLDNDTLSIEIDEGKIERIVVNGNNRTKDYVILREFPLKPGNIFNYERASIGINNIHSTDLFTNVSFEIKQTDNAFNLIIKTIEKSFLIARMSMNYNLDFKGKGFLELTDENIGGTGSNLYMVGKYGLREQLLNLGFSSERIFHTFLTYKVDLYHNRLREFTYKNGNRIGEFKNKINGFSLSFGQQLKRLGKVSATALFESSEIVTMNGEGFPTGRLDIRGISFQSIIDTQEKYPFPTKGKYYNFYYEIASALKDGRNITFFKLYSSLETFFSFRKRNTLNPKISWGTSDVTTPFSEQFKIGGLNSLYGLNENEYRGRHFLLASLQYRYLMPSKLDLDFYWGVRYDIGATWENAEDIKPKDLNNGIGVSLSINTFLGPVTVAYGWHESGKETGYFSLGYEF